MLGYVLIKVMSRNAMELSATTKNNKIKRLKKHLSKRIKGVMVNSKDEVGIKELKILGVVTTFSKDQWDGEMNKVQFS